MSVPIVDSLTHPTLSGTWLGKAIDPAASFDRLTAEMASSNIERACAIGMWGLDGYAHELFAAACRRHPELIPVAGFRPVDASSDAAELDRIRDLGFVGVKIHPRFSQLDLRESAQLGGSMEAAAQRGLTIWFCTYQHCALESWPEIDPFQALVRLLKAAPTARVILVHGGDIDVMRHMQLVRFNDRLLLDLSMTLCKYPGSSLDLDLAFLFRQFDRRICIGSDWPQHTAAETRDRFEQFAHGIDSERAARIAGRNLLDFLKVD
jgi:predicted TIM-barrel fold metal-dependent hydrolase